MTILDLALVFVAAAVAVSLVLTALELLGMIEDKRHD